MTGTAHRIVLASRPRGEPALENFRLEQSPMPVAGASEMLLRVLWLSLDPYMRGRMSDAPSYAKPVAIDQVMEGETVSEVVTSSIAGFSPGDLIVGHTGWRTHALSNGKGFRKVDGSAAPVSTALGVLGMPGMTAYTGLLDIGQPKAGETIVVAAASGAVGSVVGQIARIKGARAIGIAGGSEKCRYVREEIKFDDCMDHRSPTLAADLARACPNGIDVYFESVGGKVFEAVLPLFNTFARMPVCGLIGQSNVPVSSGGVPAAAFMRSVLVKRLYVRGFIVYDFASREADFLNDMSHWVREGRVKYRESVVEELANAPRAFIDMLGGGNFGKQLVRVAS